MREKLKDYQNLNERRNHSDYVWIRQILALSSGGLALLVAFQPDSVTLIQGYLLSATWVLLGLGVLSASGAAYEEVSLADNLLVSFRESLLKNLEDEEETNKPLGPIEAKPGKLYSMCKKVMVVSLLLSVVSLVSYAVTRTLGI
jgi:hypothetical protein